MSCIPVEALYYLWTPLRCLSPKYTDFTILPVMCSGLHHPSRFTYPIHSKFCCRSDRWRGIWIFRSAFYFQPIYSVHIVYPWTNNHACLPLSRLHHLQGPMNHLNVYSFAFQGLLNSRDFSSWHEWVKGSIRGFNPSSAYSTGLRSVGVRRIAVERHLKVFSFWTTKIYMYSPRNSSWFCRR